MNWKMVRMYKEKIMNFIKKIIVASTTLVFSMASVAGDWSHYKKSSFKEGHKRGVSSHHARQKHYPTWLEDYRSQFESIEVPVLSTTPVYETVKVRVTSPCVRPERVRYVERGRSASGADTLAGAIIGGVIGNQIGGGSGKDIATVFGTLLGASIASDKGRSPSREYERFECNDVVRYETRRQLVGYRVKYEYSGAIYTKIVSSDPGKYISI